MSDLPTALVTGAAARVGATIVETLHRRGHRVAIHYRSSAGPAEALAARLNARRADSAVTVRGDLGDEGACAALVTAVLDRWGRLDVLVNNASDFYPTPVASITAADWERLFASNARGPLFVSLAAIPALRAARGAIVNIVDIHAERPLPRHTVYCMAKAALVMLTRSLALELGPEVRVNGIAPGAILWPEPDISDEEKAATLALVPLGRRGEPENIASAVCQLALDNDYVTGQILAVDGGRSLNL